MLMVIAGAGASFDSSAEYPPGRGEVKERYRPPIADRLFEGTGHRGVVRGMFPQMSALIPRFLPHPGQSLEQVLQQIQDEAAKTPLRKVQLAAVQFYLHVLFKQTTNGWINETAGITNYLSLFDRIAHYYPHEPVCIVTFNYDLLIEHALGQQYGVRFDVISDYMSNPAAKLFKLHGSANWLRAISSLPPGLEDQASDRGDIWMRTLIQNAGYISFHDVYNVEGALSGPAFPAIAIPVQTKDQFACPPEQVASLEALIRNVDKIISIGWRGAETHFLNLLQKGLAGKRVRAVVVAKDETEAAQTANVLRALGFGFKADCLGGFSTCIREGKFDALLGAP